jgi:RNA polymerase sigma-70 factor (ECF subfamily)
MVETSRPAPEPDDPIGNAPDGDGPLGDGPPGDGLGIEDLSGDQCRALFDELAGGLRSFLRNRLRQESDVDDCLQVVFIKMLESIDGVAPAARRAWVFRVAANEAARWWRSEASRGRVLEKHGVELTDSNEPIDRVLLTESAQQLEHALMSLPAVYREVVRLRIHDNKTFQEIADQLGIPLGTALTRMRRALDRLRSEIDQDHS